MYDMDEYCSIDFIRMYNMRLTSLITCDFALRSSDPGSLTSSSSKRSPSPSVAPSVFTSHATRVSASAWRTFYLFTPCCLTIRLFSSPLFHQFSSQQHPPRRRSYTAQGFAGVDHHLKHADNTLRLASINPSNPLHTHTTMAPWETNTSNDGGAAEAGFGDTAAQPADTTTDTLDMTPLAGALTEAETAAFRERAREAGWVDNQPVDYAVRQSSHDTDMTNYLTHSAVYEWNDEYGDVGPEVPDLEQQLFGGDFRVRQGQHMDKLQFEVTVEGPDKLQPARSVSTLLPSLPLHIADRITVRRRWTASDHARDRHKEDGLQDSDSHPGLHDPRRALRRRRYRHFSNR
jgi:hypothetical protein